MSMSRSFNRKIAAGLAATGICASLALSAAVAPGLATAATTHLSGAGGQTAGTLVQASPTLTAYWNKEASHARSLDSAVSSTDRRTAGSLVAERPQGPSGHVAGTVGSLARTSRTQATPDSGPNGTPWWGSSTEAPATTTGKVFFKDHKGGNWVCSGSLVNSAAKNVVITAGHCVYGTAGGELPAGETWHSDWVFAPDYKNHDAPYGYWTAKQLWTVTNYINNGDEQDDLGAAILNTNSAGQNAIALFGGQGFAWNQSSSQYMYAFGYPAASPFNGELLEECDGSVGYNSSVDMEMMKCNFTGGSSGGPWLMSFNGEWGYIDSVVDAGYSAFPGQTAGLYFGNNAENLYDTVANV